MTLRTGGMGVVIPTGRIVAILPASFDGDREATNLAGDEIAGPRCPAPAHSACLHGLGEVRLDQLRYTAVVLSTTVTA